MDTLNTLNALNALKDLDTNPPTPILEVISEYPVISITKTPCSVMYELDSHDPFYCDNLGAKHCGRHYIVFNKRRQSLIIECKICGHVTKLNVSSIGTVTQIIPNSPIVIPIFSPMIEPSPVSPISPIMTVLPSARIHHVSSQVSQVSQVSQFSQFSQFSQLSLPSTQEFLSVNNRIESSSQDIAITNDETDDDDDNDDDLIIRSPSGNTQSHLQLQSHLMPSLEPDNGQNSCPGCATYQANQQCHMVLGGCLYSGSVEILGSPDRDRKYNKKNKAKRKRSLSSNDKIRTHFKKQRLE